MEIDLAKITNPDIRELLSNAENTENLAKGYFLLGVEAGEKKDWEVAIKYYKAALAIRSVDPVSLYFSLHNIASSLIHLERYEEAADYAQAAIAANEDWPYAYNAFGVACRALGKYKEAAWCFLTSTLKKPKDKTAWLQLQSLVAARPELPSQVPAMPEAIESARKFLESRGELPRTNWRSRWRWGTTGGAVGRPAERPGGQRVNVYLDTKSLTTAKKLGDGNVSSGIRKALAQTERAG